MPVNNINQRQEYAFISSEFFTLAYLDGSNWVDVPGIQGWSSTNSGSPTREIRSANAATVQRQGQPGAQTVSIDATALPTHYAYRRLMDAQRDRDTMTFRIDTDGERVFTSIASGATAQISTTSVLTFNGVTAQAAPTVANSSIGEGAVVSIGATLSSAANYIIDTIDDNNAITVRSIGPSNGILAPSAWTRPTTAVTAAVCRIWNPPPTRFEFTAGVTQIADFSLAAEGEMTTTISLALRKPMPYPTIFIPTT